MSDRPSLEAHARELLDMPPEWRAFRWEAKGRGVLVEGAIPLAVYKRGPRKGKPKWNPRTDESAIVVLDNMHTEWLAQWESRTGKCHACAGSGQEWAGWSLTTGVSYRPCQRCGATG
jgi:hypothetical protein